MLLIKIHFGYYTISQQPLVCRRYLFEIGHFEGEASYALACMFQKIRGGVGGHLDPH